MCCGSELQDPGLRPGLEHSAPGPHSPPRYVQKEELCGGREDTHRREGSKGKGQEKEQDGWGGGQGPDSAGIWGWGCPRSVGSLWGRAGQLLLVEAHDVVHELVLLARLDHATPVGPRGKWGGVTSGPRLRRQWPQLQQALKVHLRPWHCGRDCRDIGAWLCLGSPAPSFLCSQQEASLYPIPPNRPCPPTCPCPCPCPCLGPPVLPELACDLEDVHHALPPQLLAADAGGDEAASPADARTEGQGGQGRAQWVRAGAEHAEAVLPDPLQGWPEDPPAMDHDGGAAGPFLLGCLLHLLH